MYLNGKDRIQSIDALRGISIFGMVFCASIGWSSNLPDWMFHCQVPPPDYVFKPEVRGITWVDMIFPIFIFAMGAAFPFSIGKRLDKGESLAKVAVRILKRWAVLVAFGLGLGHSQAIAGLSCDDWVKTVVPFILWLSMFAALIRTDKMWVNISGWLAALVIILGMHFLCDLPLDTSQNDIIIILLSTVALLGGFIYMLTRNNIRLRTLAWLLIIATKLVGWEWGQYLVIALPASIAGDIIASGKIIGRENKGGICAALAIAAVLVQLWGLYTRNVFLDGAISFALGAAFLLLTIKHKSLLSRIGWMGFALLLAGIAFDPLDGGIAKDYCNISYVLVTGGQASLMLYCLLWLESHCPLSRSLTMTGQNPMIAYTVAWALVCPLLSLSGLMGLIDAAAAGSPVMGIVRGLIVTLLMMAVTCIFTRHRIFWRS